MIPKVYKIITFGSFFFFFFVDIVGLLCYTLHINLIMPLDSVKNLC